MYSSIREKIFNLVLPLVEKPGRYIGNETNIIRKPFNPDMVRIALCFPEAYELGMSHAGFSILYHIINQQDNFTAERVYTPRPDMEELLKHYNLPLYTLENFTPIAEMDVLGFTLQYELSFTNILTMLDLGNIPLFAKDRKDNMPLVIAGGPCATNPEPIAEYLDAVVLGDGEEVVLEILRIAADMKGAARKEKLRKLSKIPGIYVPGFYKPVYLDNGDFSGLEKVESDAPDVINVRKVKELDSSNYPAQPLIPLIETTHDRLGVELMRGCTRGCRFCSAGYFYRPVRERSVSDVISQTKSGIQASGWEEASFLSLSTTDYSSVKPLLKQASEMLSPQKVNLSLPSIRSDTVTIDMLENVSNVRKSSLTIAPEAGSERLRKIINKNLTEEEILSSVRASFEKGWQTIKLYFMIGLPQEEESDIEAIIDLIKKIRREAQNFIKRPGIHVSIAAFSPKPHTPFQWVAWAGEEILLERAKRIKGELRLRGIEVSYSNMKTSFLESVIARGDRKISRVLFDAWKRGARFDAWSEYFDYGIWDESFRAAGTDPQQYVKEIPLGNPLPWDIMFVASKKFLVKEYNAALRSESIADCRTGKPELCCGVCTGTIDMSLQAESATDSNTNSVTRPAVYGRRKRLVVPANSTQFSVGATFRIQYTKNGPVRFLGHLDMLRLIERALRRSGLPVSFSQGFHPHPKISFGPPTSVGHESKAEYFDVRLDTPISGNIEHRLNLCLPDGIEAVASCSIFTKTKSLVADICAADYSADIPDMTPQELANTVKSFLDTEKVEITRKTKSGEKTVDIRPYILNLETTDNHHENEKDSNSATIRMRLGAGQNGHAKPMEILKLLLTGWPEQELLHIPITRLAQWVERSGNFMSPIDI